MVETNLGANAAERSSISAKELIGLNLHYKEISSLMLINLGKPYKYTHIVLILKIMQRICSQEQTEARSGPRGCHSGVLF